MFLIFYNDEVSNSILNLSVVYGHVDAILRDGFELVFGRRSEHSDVTDAPSQLSGGPAHAA